MSTSITPVPDIHRICPRLRKALRKQSPVESPHPRPSRPLLPPGPPSRPDKLKTTPKVQFQAVRPYPFPLHCPSPPLPYPSIHMCMWIYSIFVLSSLHPFSCLFSASSLLLFRGFCFWDSTEGLAGISGAQSISTKQTSNPLTLNARTCDVTQARMRCSDSVSTQIHVE